MEAVTEHVLSDYQDYLRQLRLEIDLFQERHADALLVLQQKGKNASTDEYMLLLNQLRHELKHSRLFALVNHKGEGVLKHITGNFGDDCEEEVELTVQGGHQETLFLHHNANKIHFDLLQPLKFSDSPNHFLFVAFNPTELKALMARYQLPHQQLFLLRKDKQGKIELSREHSEVEAGEDIVMSKADLERFSFVEPIPRTRWLLAIRLSAEYSTNVKLLAYTKALVIWLLLSAFLFSFYRWQQKRARSYLAMQEQIAFKDQHDQLTALANRLHFETTLNDFLQTHSKQQNGKGVVMLADIDQFQLINNSQGYAFGDSLLAQVSILLSDYLPENALASRLGNDEFAILLPELAHDDAAEEGERLREYFVKMHTGESLGSLNFSASIGVLVLDSEQSNSDQVLQALGQAVQVAKLKGRNRVQMYQSQDKQLRVHASEMRILRDISSGLADKRFELYRQKIHALNTQHNDHYEVLLRLRDKQGDIISPGVLINAAEKYGLIKQLDIWVIESVCQAIAQDTQDDAVYSINLSGVTLAQPGMFEKIRATLLQHGVPPSRIAFEVTETAAISHLKSAQAFMQKIKEMGCQFYLDDFGSGMSSVGYLQQLQVDVIKIDGVFVKDLHENKVNAILVENMLRTAHALGKLAVAEFVENAAIAEQLTAMGVDFAQGYYFHKPEPWYKES